MDFVKGLPSVRGKSVILTIVNLLSKYVHFIPLGYPYTMISVAQAFFIEVVRLHYIPNSIVVAHDPVTRSMFWPELFHLARVKLNLSSAFHPQSGGQLEAANHVIGVYLWCLIGDRPHHWLRWFPWEEICFNSAYRSSLRSNPFQVVYGWPPPTLCCYDNAAWQNEISFLRKSRNVSSKLGTTQSYTVTTVIATWSSAWAIVCGFAFCTRVQPRQAITTFQRTLQSIA
uniref:Retrotransposon protein, putative, unclassified n=1 Tax=Oryza sativa subsp. japonica TaxID=39947 RepID=Q2QRS2_ORYSJ|nr:retrotransposon protein, putative, unclassified [Oryza sativa Japonica Group]